MTNSLREPPRRNKRGTNRKMVGKKMNNNFSGDRICSKGGGVEGSGGGGGRGGPDTRDDNGTVGESTDFCFFTLFFVFCFLFFVFCFLFFVFCCLFFVFCFLVLFLRIMTMGSKTTIIINNKPKVL